jgi:hypothetical protein
MQYVILEWKTFNLKDIIETVDLFGILTVI